MPGGPLAGLGSAMPRGTHTSLPLRLAATLPLRQCLDACSCAAAVAVAPVAPPIPSATTQTAAATAREGVRTVAA
jgi:hypothetical protein